MTMPSSLRRWPGSIASCLLWLSTCAPGFSGCARRQAPNPSPPTPPPAAETSPQTGMPSGHSAFRLTLPRQQLIGVSTGTAEKKRVFKSIHASGNLAFDPELYTAQNEYLEALSELERVRDSPIEEVRSSARKMVGSARLRLRILGLSDARIREIGQTGNSGRNLLLTRKGSSAWVYGEIYEMDLPFVHAGMEASVTAGFLAGKTLEGRVVSVDTIINPTTRTARARISVPNAHELLRPESYVDVTLRAPMGEQVVVPFDAVLDTGEQAWVFLAGENGWFEPRKVAILFQDGGEVALASGLRGGERIVTSANFLIDSESRLKFSETEAAAAGPSSKARAPACPEGQHWDVPMSMCMPGK